MGALIHGSSYIIILPLAEHGDLDKLLYSRGDASASALVSAPNEVNDERFHEDLLQQMWNVSDALDWLHTSLSVPGHQSIFAAHFDLKPDNIMIQTSTTSCVGQWVVSDFGLSVFQTETGRRDDELHSIGDMASDFSREASQASKITMDARTERKIGTYLPPEAESNRQAGRRSDVWSLVAISSEVLAFALGGAKKVEEYQDLRLESDRYDRFYSKMQHSNPASEPQYCVKPAVQKFLLEIASNAGPETYIQKWVDSIQQCLVIDHDQRPNSKVVKEGHWKALAGIHIQKASSRQSSGSSSLASHLGTQSCRYPRTQAVSRGLRYVRPQSGQSRNSSDFINCKPWPPGQTSGPKSVAVSNGGCCVAWLLPSAIRVDQILNASEFKTVQLFELDGKGWDNIVIGGSLVAAWGFSRDQGLMKVRKAF